MNLKEYRARKYFIYGFKEYISNRNKLMAKRHVPSIREVILEYINLYNERIQDISNKKLENAENDMIKAVSFYLKTSVFYKEKIYKREIDLILKNLNGNITEKKSTYIMCYSFLKKMEIENYYKYLVQLIKQSNSFGEIDKIIYSFVSELIYDGYSINKLDDWYNSEIRTRDINEENIDEKLDQFSSLKQRKQYVTFYITIKNFNVKDVFLSDSIKLTKRSVDELKIPKDKLNYLQISSSKDIYTCDVMAMDVDKALEILINSFDSYIHMHNYLAIEKNGQIKGIEIGEKIIAYTQHESYIKMRKIIKDEKLIFQYNEENERRDIQRFIEYRNNVYKEGIANEEVSNIQRALNIVTEQMHMGKESRIINLWSVLEYMLTFHDGKNIIAKVQDIVPKVVILYVIKDEINMFWSNLLRYEKSENESISNFIENCVEDKEIKKYSLLKLIRYILKRGEALANELNFNDILLKQVSTIGSMLTNKKYRSDFIKHAYEEIEYDLIKIYRDRNSLVHSGKKTVQDINGKILRLYRYNNSLLGVIIYYKSKNPYLTIQEILNSICYTYDYYKQIIGEDTEGDVLKAFNICRPSYLFLE